MNELWNSFMEWYHSANIDTIINWCVVVGVPTMVAVISKTGKNAQLKEIVAMEKQRNADTSLTDFKGFTSTKINEIYNNFNQSLMAIDKLSSLVLLLIQNSNISAENKAYALKVFSSVEAKKTEIATKVEETKQIVNDTKAKVEEAVKQEKVEDVKKEEELKSSLDKLKEEVINDKK